MKLISWNNRNNSNNNTALLPQLGGDVVIVPECKKPITQISNSDVWRDSTLGKNRGLGVFAFGTYSVELGDAGGRYLPSPAHY
jgi:hypothetical protein